MPLLVQTKYDDLLHNLRAKTMLSKMYYELQEWNALDNLLDSFKVYISRKKHWLSQGKLHEYYQPHQENGANES